MMDLHQHPNKIVGRHGLMEVTSSSCLNIHNYKRFKIWNKRSVMKWKYFRFQNGTMKWSCCCCLAVGDCVAQSLGSHVCCVCYAFPCLWLVHAQNTLLGLVQCLTYYITAWQSGKAAGQDTQHTTNWLGSIILRLILAIAKYATH